MADGIGAVASPWAKLARDCREQRGRGCRAACDCAVTASLSVIGHGADVAAVLQALLERPVIARRLARLLGQAALTPGDVARLSALGALHDLGKVNQGFQRKPFARRGAGAGHIAPLVALLGNGGPTLDRLLGQGGLQGLRHLLADADGRPHPFLAVLAHHGSLPEPGRDAPELWRAEAGYDPLAASRDLIDAIRHWCPAALQPTPVAWTPEFGHAFAGLVTLADWLGSDEVAFAMPGGDVPDGAGRFGWALDRARALLTARGLAPEAARGAAAALPRTSTALTGFADPTPAQAAMLALGPAPPTGRTCLIEAETGSGKTEAAVIHFLDLFGRGEVDGMYVALPTRAAARQIHSRIETMLRRLLGDAAPHVTLAVPGYLEAGPADATLPETGALWADAADDARRDALWASERPKRYLAGFAAIGTIDQVLMGAVRVRHAQLRSGAMLRLLLVVDEVHASDTYMTAILRAVLDQHRAAGGHALLMSATLGSHARGKLLQPKDRAPPGPDYETAVAAPYPAVWSDASPEPLGPPVAAEAAPQKQVRVVLSEVWNDPAATAARAAGPARQGARVLVIRNTVRDVVATQRALEAIAPDLAFGVPAGGGDIIRCPHHARYAPEDRTLLDAALESTLGRSAIRAGGCVAITSQTAEQSLDIDADLLITDLCPADVLLQRIGRLHRHRRPSRPAGFADPTAIVLAPTEADLAARIDATGAVRAAPLALGLVYPNLLGVLATRRALAARPCLQIPRDNRRLVETSTHPGQLRALAEALGAPWMQRWTSQEGIDGAQATEARGACIDWGKPIEPLPRDRHIVVRLGLDDRSVDLPAATIGPFGRAISVLTIPGRWLHGVAADAAPAVEQAEPGTIAIKLDARRFRYDRLGLRPHEVA